MDKELNRNGQGIYNWKDGRTLVATYKNNIPQGQATYTINGRQPIMIPNISASFSGGQVTISIGDGTSGQLSVTTNFNNDYGDDDDNNGDD